MSTQKHIARFEDVEEGEEFWSAEGRLYVRGFTRDPENGITSNTANLGLRPDHAAGDPMEGTDPESRFDERNWLVEGDRLTVRPFEDDELVLRGGPGVERPEGRVRFFAGEED